MERDISLDDKYSLEEGVIYATGVQALVRLPMDQERQDRRQGLHTAGFISGYQGSPLGNYDLALARAGRFLDKHHIVHVPGVNEELAATSVLGSQITHVFPGQKFDGVVGYWYGKAPGVDRSGDAFRHANFAGAAKTGGALILAGDDPVAKSSTVPSGSESILSNFGFPILYPGSTQEVLDLGLHGVALSRFCGSWVALKLVNNVCDGGGTAEVAPDRITPCLPELQAPDTGIPEAMRAMLVAAVTLPMEAHVHDHRLQAAVLYARANRLNQITVNPTPARLGIVAGGKTYRDLLQALRDMGLTDEDLRRAGIRLLRLGLIYPLDAELLYEFAAGLERIVVVEEKRSFIEQQMRDLLYNRQDRPHIIGKFDLDRAPLFPLGGGLSPDLIGSILGPEILRLGPLPPVEARLAELRDAETLVANADPGLARTNNFCSGCPHNRSTLLLEGQLAGGGIGCHTMAVMTGQRERSIQYVTQMGGEGAVWVGASPFVEHPHMFQNLGDGTYFHSGRLGVESAIAAGVRMTFKILYNSHVAMTGGQQAAGAVAIPALTRELHAMGTSRIFLVAEDPKPYRRQRGTLAPGVEVYHRDELEQVLKECEAVPGVSVLIYDQPCAAERRRQRRRGLAPIPERHILINPEVCEGCGDCGVKSNCMSVIPLDTEFGRKTTVHRSSCNQDELCLKGDCPAFVLVETRPEGGVRKRTPRAVPELESQESLPEPENKAVAGDGYTILMTGVGGTGVVTVNALLAVASLLEGKHCSTLDQIGLAQKGGAVVSSAIIAEGPVEGTNMPSTGGADLLLGLDCLGAVQPDNLKVADRQKTAAVINTTGAATAEMVRNKEVQFPSKEQLSARITKRTDARRTLFADAGALVENLFGDHMMTNIFCLGMAYQAGFVPLAATSIEAALRLNGVAVERNLAAFRAGRHRISDPRALEPSKPGARSNREEAHHQVMAELSTSGHEAQTAFQELSTQYEGPEALRAAIEIRLANLILYQDGHYARKYLDFVQRTRAWESEQTPGHEEITGAVARYLYKLMANKDEYEVARLHLRTEARRRIDDSFEGVRKVSFLLHPPTFRRWGLKRKLALGPAWRPVLRLLARMKVLRGGVLDVFGRSAERRLERSLVGWYRNLVEEACSKLTPQNRASVLQLVEIPDSIRGYEEIRKQSIDQAKAKASESLQDLDPPRHRVAV